MLVGLIVLLHGTLNAQFEFGAYVGTNANKLRGEAPRNFVYEARTGLTVGGILHYYVKPDVRISFQPGYSFTRPDAQYRDRELDEVRDTARFNLDYIKLPIYLDILSNNRKWHYIAGVDFQVSLGQEIQIIDGEEIDISDEITAVNPSIYFGIGRRIRVGQNILNIDLRFGQGILNISNRPDDNTSYIPRIKTSVAELLVSYEFVNPKTQDE